MTNKNNFWTDADVGILLLRITLGGLLFLHGFHKVTHGIENQMQLLANKGIPEQLMYFVYVSEVLAPVLIVLGVFVRLSTLSIVITMITILYVAPFPILGLDEHGALNGELQFLYLLCPAALCFIGAGRYRLWNSGTKNWLMD